MTGRRKTTGKLDFTKAELAEAANVVRVVGPIVPILALALQPRTEVVLHDLTSLPRSIAAIGGTITGREVGGPATDLGVRTFQSGWQDHMVGYRTEGPDGTVMRSASIFFYAASGKAIACLCLNRDIGDLSKAQQILAKLTVTAPLDSLIGGPLTAEDDGPASVENVREEMLEKAIASVGVPVELMKKAHKVEVVRDLTDRGFFAIREAVEVAAQRLGVSRYTIYNYLNEIQSTPKKP